MPKQYSPQEIEEHYRELPEILKDALFDADVANRVYAIGTKSNLVKEQIEALAEETGFLIVGLSHPQEFVKNIVGRLEINEEQARALAHELNIQIFSPLRDALKTTHKIEVGEIETPIPATPPPQEKIPQPPQVRPPPPLPAEEEEDEVVRPRFARQPPQIRQDLSGAASQRIPPRRPPPQEMSPQSAPPRQTAPPPPRITPTVSPQRQPQQEDTRFSSPHESKIPPIDLRRPPQQPRPLTQKISQGRDPYRESME